MDRMYGEYAITHSARFQQALAEDAGAQEFLNSLCPQNYCNDNTHPEERFAELFAYHNACNESNAHLKQMMPNVSKFFDNLATNPDYLKGN
jgi:hypothetical protein